MLRNIHQWLPGYLASRKRGEFVSLTHLFFCFCDHYEPLWNGGDGKSRVKHWLDNYPKLARFRDVDGKPPQHSFFYPAEEYRPEFLADLAKLCRQGFGEVEIHLHHRNDTAENLRAGLLDFKVKLKSHGFLSHDRYGFIHGNWCLDNSRRDGDWCGVNNELLILKETGCYADFTLPSAPSDTQTRKVNSIYYATDDPLKPKSHDTGVDVRVGGHATGDLLIVQGPLALNWRRRKIENADVAGYSPATLERAHLWLKQRIGVAGKPDWVFVKVHTHGCQERNMAAVLDGTLHEALAQLPVKLHYVTARETFNLIKAAEAGKPGDPNQYRDFVLPPPPVFQ
ncbi:MAG: hypothetical protein PCFJNLEI_03519 [Verrucomicrobiae bacterium]|nr:hypothetical protein [Verrucomicrobiae bacterium]